MAVMIFAVILIAPFFAEGNNRIKSIPASGKKVIIDRMGIFVMSIVTAPYKIITIDKITNRPIASARA